MLGEDARELRQGLLGLVLVVVGDEHDFLAFAGAFRADVGERGVRRAGDEAEQGEGEDGEGAHGRIKEGNRERTSADYGVECGIEYRGLNRVLNRMKSTEYRVRITEF